nr:hypothetical protein [Tanacetum cinerariifolium]
MGDEHLSTILKTESNEVIKSSVKNLVPIPSESEVTSDNERCESQMEEIDLFLASDDLMPPGIEKYDYDSEGDIHFLEELLSDEPLPLPKNESSNFYHHDDPSFPRPPLEPPDVEIFFDFEPDTGVLTAKVVEDISEHYVLMPKVFPTRPALCPNIYTLLLFHLKTRTKCSNLVTDMSKLDNIEAKRTKPGTFVKRVQEIEAEDEFISNLIPLILYPK